MKPKFLLITAVVLLSALLIPLYVYITYPEVYSEEESFLEGSVAKVVPFKPPKFLVGSLIYGSMREVLSLRKPVIERYDSHLILKLDETKKYPLLLASAYSEVSTRELLPREQVIDLIAQGTQTIKVAFFRTQRGTFSIVLEVTVNDKHYVIVPKNGRS